MTISLLDKGGVSLKLSRRTLKKTRLYHKPQPKSHGLCYIRRHLALRSSDTFRKDSHMQLSNQAGMVGFAPTLLVKPIAPKAVEPVNPEQTKYEKLWKTQEYRAVSPGEQWSFTFFEQARPEPDAEIIDFGCGTGRGGLNLAFFGKMRVKMLDFAENCLDEDVAEACKTQPTRIQFYKQDLTQDIPHTAAYGYCCDVMEHIPTEDVPKVLRNILASAHHVFFGISTVDDVMGKLIGEPLHLTVKPIEWWVQQLTSAGAVVLWSARLGNEACAIYCSTWKDAGELVKTGILNVTEEILNQQVKHNIEAGWKNVTPYNRQDREVVLLAGGPSMPAQLDKIRTLREEDGCALVTVNGSYNWAIEQGLVPSAQVVLDGRAFNARFVRPIIDTCMYLIASQAHPKTFEGLPHERTFMWHSGISDENEKLVRDANGGLFFPIPGGSTVVLRAIPLLRMLGYWRFHIFGFDSCVLPDGKHHGYEQPENDRAVTIPVTCGGKVFDCVPWMVSQASEFRDLVQFLGDEVELAVYGEGLISQMIATGASFSTEQGV